MGGGGIPYFGPVKNEDYVGDPMKVGFTKAAKKIPILIGSVISEFSFLPAQYDKSKMTDIEMEEAIRSRFGNADGQKLIDLFRKAYPERKVIDVLTIDSQAFRYWSKKWIEKRISENTAPTYSYLFTLDFDFKGGVPAWHCSDIPFFFHNIDKVPIANIDGVSDRLQDQMSGAFVSFAKTGNPGHEQLPDWPNCTASDEATMLFDRQCQVKHNFDTELISLHKKLNVCSMPKIEG
jgi:para-nitrobenzyl esterase